MSLTALTPLVPLAVLAILGPIPSTVSAQGDFPPPGSQFIQPTDAEIYPIPGEHPDSLAFGETIASDGKDLLVGMPVYRNHTGRVAVFHKDPSGVWQRVGTLEASDARPDNGFGGEVGLEGDCAMVGAGTGRYQFRRKHGTWVQVQKAADGQLTCEHDDVFVSEPDGVHVLRADKWGRLDPTHPRQILTNWEGNPDAGFGLSISASGRTLAIGAPLDDELRGAVFTFIRHGSRWVMGQKLIAIDGQPGDLFGRAISVSDHLIAIGAPRKSSPPDPECLYEGPYGAAYVFASSGQLWFERERIETPQCAVEFGLALVINRRLLAIGDSSVRYIHAGSAYVYRPTGGRFTLFGVAGGPGAGSPVLALTPSTLFVGFPIEPSPWPIGHVDVYPFGRGHSRSDSDRRDDDSE